MSVSSVGSSQAVAAARPAAKSAEAGEVKGAPDHDGDADDGGAKVAKAPTPTVNMSGQTIGKMVHVTA